RVVLADHLRHRLGERAFDRIRAAPFPQESLAYRIVARTRLVRTVCRSAGPGGFGLCRCGGPCDVRRRLLDHLAAVVYGRRDGPSGDHAGTSLLGRRVDADRAGVATTGLDRGYVGRNWIDPELVAGFLPPTHG